MAGCWAPCAPLLKAGGGGCSRDARSLPSRGWWQGRTHCFFPSHLLPLTLGLAHICC